MMSKPTSELLSGMSEMSCKLLNWLRAAQSVSALVRPRPPAHAADMLYDLWQIPATQNVLAIVRMGMVEPELDRYADTPFTISSSCVTFALMIVDVVQ